MPVSHESVTFDVHDFKVYRLVDDPKGGASATYDPAVDVPGIAEVSLEPNLVTAELKGDARVIAKRGRVDRLNLSATYGMLSLDVLNVVLGGDPVTDDADVSATWTMKGRNTMPYFKVEFKVEDADVGDIHVILPKCQVTGGTLLNQSTDEFGQPTMDLEAIPLASTDEMGIIRFLDEATELSA